MRAFAILTILLLFCSCTPSQDDVSFHKKKAKQYFENEEYEKAKIEYLNVTQLDPKNDSGYMDLGETYLKLQDPFKAATYFAQAVVMNPNNLKAKLRLGQLFMLAKETRKAREKAIEILDKDPGNVEAMHLLSSIQIQEKNFPSAVKTLKKAIETDPTDHRSYLYLAHLLLNLNRFDEAEPLYLKTIELNNTLRTPYLELARMYKKRGEIDKVEPIIKQWFHSPGDKVQKSYDWASFQEINGKIDAAESTLLEASVNKPQNIQALLNLGDFYARRKNAEAAMDMFRRALSIDKNNLDIRAHIAALNFELKEYQKTEKDVADILQKDEKHKQANFLKGLLLFNKKNPTQALKYFDIVLSKDPNHARARYYKAKCLLDSGSSDLPGQDLFRVAEGYATTESWERKLAVDELKKVLEIDPEFTTARIQLADVYLQDQDTRSAKRHLNYILKKEPENTGALVLAGRLKVLEKDLKGAEKIYNEILNRHPDYAAGHVSIGLAFVGLKQRKEAIGAFNKALEINPEQMDALSYIVTLHIQKQEVNEALRTLNDHRKRFKEKDTALAFIDIIEGKVYLIIENIIEAKKFFHSAINRIPSLFSPYDELAKIAIKEKDIDTAILNYEMLLQIKPHYLPTYIYLSHIYYNKEDFDRARDYLKKALEINRDYAPAANNLAYMLSESKTSLYEALRLAKVARDQDPKNPMYIDTLGWIYYLQGSIDLALRELEESIEINPDNALTHYHIGWAYYDAKNFKKARQHMTRVLEINPDFQYAEKARELLGE